MKNIATIIKLSKPLHKLVFLLSGLILFGAAVSLAAPILSKFIVDDIVNELQTKSGNLHTVIILVVAAFVLNLVSLVTEVVSERLGDHFAGRLKQFLTEMFYDKTLSLPQSYFDSQISGKIINQLARGITSIQNFLNTSTNFILPTIVQSIFTIAILAYYNWPIAIFTFLLFPVYLGLSYYSTIKWGREEVKKNAIEDRTRGRIQEVIANMNLVKSFNSQVHEYRTASDNLTEINRIYATQSHTYHVFDFFRGLSLNIILFIINLIVFYDAFQGALSVGTMVLILQLVAQVRVPLFSMSFILTQIQTAESGSKEYLEILQLSSTEDYKAKEAIERVKEPRIRFDHVTFKYESSNDVLRDVSFEIQNREQVALVGHSGAGKTTIVNLLLKFYEPSGGQIYLGETGYNSLSHRFVRENIALVFQESELFSSTIRENVAYGKPSATEEEIVAALKAANAYDFVMRFPKGIESEVGERGVKLSGGQKQRIQIARAILKDAPILILDEATSSLDAKSESEVHTALEKLMENRLTLIIAHRFSTIQNVDRVLVLDEGKIADSGKPKELANRPGIYSDLLRYQVEGNKKLLESFDIY